MDTIRFGLGYDLRISPAHLRRSWLAENRRGLLVPSVAAPLSADTHIWDSAFSKEKADSDPDDDSRSIYVEWPSERFAVLGFWGSREELFSAAAVEPIIARRSWLIAVEIISTQSGNGSWLNSELVGPCNVELRDALLLGYEVTNARTDSVLMNMTYPDLDFEKWHRVYASCLNASHLFFRLEDAQLFLDDIRSYDPNGPFLIAALYRLPFIGTMARPNGGLSK